MDEREKLIDGARALGLELADDAAGKLLRLLDELERWSGAYNLTAIRKREEMLTHHLLDSLAIHGDLHGRTVADVGTGAGFPGLPLAVVRPELQFTLIDSANKKLRFVTHAARTLGLGNVTALHARVETLRPEAPFDTVVARAFAALPDLLELVEPLCGLGTRVLAMKGKMPHEEMAAVSMAWRIVEARELEVPGLKESRSLVVIERALFAATT